MASSSVGTTSNISSPVTQLSPHAFLVENTEEAKQVQATRIAEELLLKLKNPKSHFGLACYLSGLSIASRAELINIWRLSPDFRYQALYYLYGNASVHPHHGPCIDAQNRYFYPHLENPNMDFQMSMRHFHTTYGEKLISDNLHLYNAFLIKLCVLDTMVSGGYRDNSDIKKLIAMTPIVNLCGIHVTNEGSPYLSGKNLSGSCWDDAIIVPTYNIILEFCSMRRTRLDYGWGSSTQKLKSCDLTDAVVFVFSSPSYVSLTFPDCNMTNASLIYKGDPVHFSFMRTTFDISNASCVLGIDVERAQLSSKQKTFLTKQFVAFCDKNPEHPFAVYLKDYARLKSRFSSKLPSRKKIRMMMCMLGKKDHDLAAKLEFAEKATDMNDVLFRQALAKLKLRTESGLSELTTVIPETKSEALLPQAIPEPISSPPPYSQVEGQPSVTPASVGLRSVSSLVSETKSAELLSPVMAEPISPPPPYSQVEHQPISPSLSSIGQSPAEQPTDLPVSTTAKLMTAGIASAASSSTSSEAKSVAVKKLVVVSISTDKPPLVSNEPESNLSTVRKAMRS